MSPQVTIFSGRGLEEELGKVHSTLSTTGGSGDWKQRIEVRFVSLANTICYLIKSDLQALSMVRSLLIAGAGQFEELTGQLKALEYPFESCVKDLRSQVRLLRLCLLLSFLLCLLLFSPVSFSLSSLSFSFVRWCVSAASPWPSCRSSCTTR
jgi:hypothetical protein